MNRYDSIPNHVEVEDDERCQPKCHSQRHNVFIGGAAAALILMCGGVFWWCRKNALSPSSLSTSSSNNNNNNNNFSLPSGVNLGSWLSLEDYFYAGRSAEQVATPFDGSYGAFCLPPLLKHHQWHSETDLLESLVEEKGVFGALQVFQAHRTTYIQESDLHDLRRLGIRQVRVPLSWCWTDASYDELVETKDDDDDDDTLLEKFTCKDPYFDGVRWPAIPKSFLENFLRLCGSYNITAVLDLHTYPGATSIGTFSGLWPRWPRFWQNDSPHNHTHTDLGRNILQDAIAWLESLDASALSGLRGLSPMNEPAHLSGILNETLQYVPLLPKHLAESYQTSLADNFPKGTQLRVLLWLHDAVQAFRNSNLPTLGKELHVNIHESIFHPSQLPSSELNDEGGRHPYATRYIAQWWSATTQPDERSSWAVLDMHHYHAWEPACMGTSVTMGNYTCSDIPARRDALERCSGWTNLYRHEIDKECGEGAKLVSAEFSASTYSNVLESCTDLDTLRDSYNIQLQHAMDANVKLFWWSYKMPYGGAFRYAWSLKHFLYLMNVMDRPDESPFECG